MGKDSRSLHSQARPARLPGARRLARGAEGGATDSSAGDVTLIVYAWANVQPGPLAWTFPSLGDARSAVAALKNAASWMIVRGHRSVEVSPEELRATGAIIAEGS